MEWSGGTRSEPRPHSTARRIRSKPISGARGVHGGMRTSDSKTEPLLMAAPSIPRPGSVSLLWDKNGGGLAIHSTQLPLATRSLTSARSSASVSTSSSRSVGDGSRRKEAWKRTKTVNNRHPDGGTAEKYPPIPTLDGLQSMSSGGMSVAPRLGNNMDRDHSLRALSPDIDQFLQDVNSALRDHTPSPPPPPSNTAEGSTSSKPDRQHRRTLRPTVAANFTGSSTNPPHNAPTTANVTPTVDVNGTPNIVKAEASLPRDETHTNLPLNSKTSQPGSSQIALCGPTDPAVPSSESVRTEAVTKIQRWYRERRAHEFSQEVQSFLQEKKSELNKSRIEQEQRSQNEAEQRQQQELEQQNRRAAKMQAARKTAIEDLQRKREEKRKATEKIALEEIALLQASGKVKRPRPQRKTRKQEKVGGAEGRKGEKVITGGSADGKVVEGSAPEAIIDEFFEAGNSRPKPAPTTPRPSLPPPALPNAPPDRHKSTYEDILDTLRLLEEEPHPLSHPGAGNEEGSRATYLSATNLQKLGTPKNLSSGSFGEGKLQSILSYLDEMERVDTDPVSQLTRAHGELKTKASPTPATANTGIGTSEQPQKDQLQLSEQLDAATAVASDVTTTIMAQRMELDNKQKTVEMLQKALSQQRELTVYHAKQMEKEGQRRLDLQKQEYEGTIQRHQSFIDQLIDDKKALGERCETLVSELRDVDKKYKHRIRAMEESHAAELSKTKQVSAAADKLRREKWRADETQRIKEATVRSLEPEIQRIIAKGKAEIQKLKAVHEAELLQADERASRRFVSQMEELRAQCALEKEQACVHERELARQRYEKLAEQEEISYQQQRRKLFQEVQQEKERQSASTEQQRGEMERNWKDLQDTHVREIEEINTQHEKSLGEIQRRHVSELRSVEERASIEKQSWEENYMKRQEAAMMAKEREMRESLRRERDKEIEMIIARLEEETTQSKSECERAAEARIKRIREKYETELREVERSECSTLEKFNSMRGELTEREGELAHVRALLRMKEQEIEQVNEVTSKLTRERDNVTDVVRQEFADRLVSTEEENRQLKMEMSELRARHRVELERVGRGKEQEMEAVHERIKQALARKEENLKALRAQHEAALKRADHLEMLLDRQRKELLKK